MQIRWIAAASVVVAMSWTTTTGAATTWHLVRAPSAAGLTYSNLGCASGRCWALTNTHGLPGIAQSSDNGQSWRIAPIHVPGATATLESLSCWGATCVAVGLLGNPGAGSLGLAMVSHNEGSTWIRVSLPAPYSRSAVGEMLNVVNCSSANRCTALGQGLYVNPGGTTSCGAGCTGLRPASSSPALYSLSTANAGATWTSAVATTGIFGANSLACSSSACVVVGLNLGHCVVKGAGRLCSSSGAALSSSTASAAAWSLSSVAPGFFQIWALSCPSGSTCYSVGASADSFLGHGVLERTSNGARTWHVVGVPAGTITLEAISCPTTNVCVIGGAQGSPSKPSAVFYETTTAARTWTRLAIPPSLNSVNSISCVGGHCVAATQVGEGPYARGVLLAS